MRGVGFGVGGEEGVCGLELLEGGMGMGVEDGIGVGRGGCCCCFK